MSLERKTILPQRSKTVKVVFSSQSQGGMPRSGPAFLTWYTSLNESLLGEKPVGSSGTVGGSEMTMICSAEEVLPQLSTMVMVRINTQSGPLHSPPSNSSLATAVTVPQLSVTFSSSAASSKVGISLTQNSSRLSSAS